MAYLPLQFEDSKIFPQKTISVRPEVHIMLSAGTMPERTERESGTTSPLFELSYSRKNILRGEVNRIPIEVQPGHTSLGFLGEVTGHSEYENGEEVCLYSIWVSPRAFERFCEDVCCTKDIEFSSFQEGPYSQRVFKSDAHEESVKRRLEVCFTENTDRLNRLLVESCLLELLSINIERLICPAKAQTRLSKTDIEQLAYARKILLNRLDSPPSLLELSHIIHMNDCKLKRSFKQYYGKTVYEFVREQRLEKAFSILEQGNCNVSEAACAVGYTNVSHFSESFKKRFGVTASDLRKG